MLANSSDLAALLSQPEGQRLAFVRRAFRVDELAETLAALANAHGGAIIVGVSGRGKKIEGVADVESARLAALDAALVCTPPLVLPLPAAAPHGDTALLLLEVPAGLPHVYSVHGKYLRRVGPINQPIPPDALRKLLIERGETSWERMAPPSATLDDLDPTKLAAYVQRSGPAAAGDPLAFLFRRGCLARGAGVGSWVFGGGGTVPNPHAPKPAPR
jgi:ATP-dependent DNA helicase RecG